MHDFERQLAAFWPVDRWSGVAVLLAVSGGADSVAMLRGLAAVAGGGEGRLIVAHFNHALRGAAADADEQFVVGLADQLGLACHVGRAAEGELARSADGLEKAARTARYHFLAETAADVGARYVATAHTADDQAETVLHRIVRGTGIRGLAGIPRVRRFGHAALVRPLLFARRSQVVNYLAALGQEFCHDATNADCALTRNRIRHELLPLLASQFNPAVVDALLRLADQAGELREIVEAQVGKLYQHLTERGPDGALALNTAALSDQPRYLVRELLAMVWRRHDWPQQAMGFAEWDLLAEMATAGAAARRTLPGSIDAEVVGSRLILRRATA